MNCTPIFKKAKEAASALRSAEPSVIDKMLYGLAAETEASAEEIIAANFKDLSRIDAKDPRYDRLLLNKDRIYSIASDLRNVASLPSPLGRILSETVRPNGLKISKVSVPFGVIGIVYEARPNVTFDVFSLCVKSGNACVLKGGSDAISSNRVITDIITRVVEQNGMDPYTVTLLPAGRSETSQLLNAKEYIDLVIPRGSRSLIDFVRQNSTIPVIETGAGICHTYFDVSGDTDKGKAIISNAKTRRVSVCNALDCLIIHRERLVELPNLLSLCAIKNVTVFADRESYPALKGKYPEGLLKKAVKESFGTEFLSYSMAVKTVGTIDEAIDHIEKYGSKHSEAIIAEDRNTSDRFLKMIDASAVYSNASTAFTDGAQFALGAEIGISTQKLHARGPMALHELTTYKWIIEGDGQIRL
jgi:glutamate-5-semialdehyde dehydrogenase